MNFQRKLGATGVSVKLRRMLDHLDINTRRDFRMGMFLSFEKTSNMIITTKIRFPNTKET